MSNDSFKDLGYNPKVFVFLDTRLTCEDETLAKASNDIWDKYLATKFKVSGRGRRPTTPYNEQFKTLFISLLLNFQNNKIRQKKNKIKECVGLYMDEGKYVQSPHNPLKLTKRFPDIVREAENAGLLVRKEGNDNPIKSFVTKIGATPLLEAELEKSEITVTQAIDMEHCASKRRDSICLKEETGKTIEVSFKDTEEIEGLRAAVDRYNELLTRHHIDVGGLSDDEWATHNVEKKSVRRIFNRGSFECGGRLYGAFWQNIKKKYRDDILIDGNETVEIDYSGMHPNICYGLAGDTPPKGDMYGIGKIDPLQHPEIHAVDTKIQRTWRKTMLLTCLNKKSNRQVEAKEFGKGLKDGAKIAWGKVSKDAQKKYLAEIQNKLKEKHKAIAQYWCNDTGIKLQRIDSDMTMEIISRFSEPVLSVHDSYIVDERRINDLKNACIDVFKSRFGFVPSLDQNTPYTNIEAQRMYKDDPLMVRHPEFVNTTERHDDYQKRLEDFKKNKAS